MHRPDTLALSAGRRTAAKLLAGCAMAPVLAALPQAAAGQAFAGSPTAVVGSPTFIDTPNATTIALKDTETVINWTPFDTAGSGTIDFLPAGNMALFDRSTGFTVLNRVLPVDEAGNPVARAIALNGGITVGRTGGNVWFYSPTGIIVGPTATISVGGLVLTTNDIVFGVNNTGGTELLGPGNTILFRGAAGSTGLVDVQDGANIQAASYVALVAPRVQQGGMVSSDGSIAYVAAEAADISINAGLFDISISAGTTDPNGVVHTGTTKGEASTGGTDKQQIMMVAMPKATALTMLLSGSIGYDPAVSAFDDGSSVILSAGYDRPVPNAESPDSFGHITMKDVDFRNAVRGYASGSIDIPGPARFESNAALYAQDRIAITLPGSESYMSVADFLSLNAGRSGKGGVIDISLGPEAPLTVGSYINLNAAGSSVPYNLTTIDATGGTITVDVDDGTLSAAGGIGVDVSAFGRSDPLLGGIGRAGSVSFTARNGGVISSSSFSANLDASGGSSSGTGGDGFGGAISLTSHGGELNLGSLYLEAYGWGGDGDAVSGSGTGGKVAILLDGGTYDWNAIDAYTDAMAGYTSGSQAGSATGRSDAISLALSNGAELMVSSEIVLNAEAEGAFDTPAGSNATGGGIDVALTGGSSLEFANLFANAQAKIRTPSSQTNPAPTRTPDATGGTISLTVDDSALAGQAISLIADASEMAATDVAGTARGGTVSAKVSNGGSLTLLSGEGGGGGDFTLSANGTGAAGQSAANAFGGTAMFDVSGGTVDMEGSLGVYAGAFVNDTAELFPSGSNPVGFDATGGTASVGLASGSLTAAGLVVDATGDASTPVFHSSGIEGLDDGDYGGPIAGNGGTGRGGTATLTVSGGTLSLPDATVSAEGYGGLSAESGSGTPFRSGDGHGGTAAATVAGGASTITQFTVSAAGHGGDGSPTGVGGSQPSLAGDGYGGIASLTLAGGTLQADTLLLDATGTGGVGGDGPDDASLTPATDGGTGTGGTARLVSTAGSTGQLTSPSIAILATGTGGAGGTAALGPNGNGGDGIGGTAEAQLADGAFDLGPLDLHAVGVGGAGVIGGDGSGGSARFILSDSAAGPSGPRTIDGLTLSASGTAGAGTGSSGQSDAGAALLTLDAHSGSVLTIDGDLAVSAEGTRSAAGDGFTASFAGEPAQVTGNTTIATTRDATVTSTSPLKTGGNLSIAARKLSGTGQFGAGGSVTVNADQGIALDELSAGTTTSLQANNGAILVATDLASGGAVSALGRSIAITSRGALNFATAQATAGGLSIGTQGNLTMAGASATGDVDLSSAAGAFSASGTVSGGGNVSIAGLNGVTAPTVVSGGTTGLTASNGAVSVASLTSTGAVTARGNSVDIASPGALTFASADAIAGNLHLAAAGDLVLTNGSASGAVDLTSSGGRIASGGAIASGSTFTAHGAAGLDLASIRSGAATVLDAPGGALTVADLVSTGPITASGRSIDIGSSTGLSFADAKATAGDLHVHAAGDLSFAQASASGAIGLSAPTGSLTATGPVTAGGNVSLAASNGLTFGSVTSGGTTSLDGGASTVKVADLVSPGPVTAVGGSLDIASSGALTFSSFGAGNGTAHIATAGNLAVGSGTAAGDIDLSSSAGAVTSTGTISSNGKVALSGDGGVAVHGLSAGGAVGLTAAHGAISVASLSTPGAVTASGRSVDLASSGQLTLASASATAGDLTLAASGLSATGPLSATGNVAIDAANGISLGALSSGGTTALTANGGAIAVTALQSAGNVTALGRSLAIASPGALTFASIGASGGAAQISTAGNLAVGSGTVSGALTLSSANGAISSAGTVTAGGAVDLNGRAGLDFNRLSSGGTTSLVSAGGPIHVANLTSAGLVTADAGGAIDIGSTEGLSFGSVKSPGATTIAAAGDLAFETIDSGQGLTLTSTGGGIIATGDVKGGATKLSSLKDINLGGAFSVDGSLAIDSRGALVSVGDVSADDATIYVDGDITMAELRTVGNAGLAANSGNILIADLEVGRQVDVEGLDIDITSSGSLDIVDAEALEGNLSISTRRNLTAETLFANHDIALTADGVFSLDGEARGVNITVRSGDIDLGGEASLGVRDSTSQLTLFNNDPSQETFIGGSGDDEGYSLDADEMLQMFSDRGITLGVEQGEFSSDEGHVTVGDFDLAFGDNIGERGFLEISTPGDISIIGNVGLTTSDEGDRFIIDPTRVELDTDTGSIALLDENGDPLGRLDVTGDTIAVGTGDTLDQLRGLADIAAINTLLDTPGGKSDALRAGSMIFTVTDGLFIQNGGASTASDDRRGFDTNALDIFTDSAAAKIVINGLIVQNGAPVTGLDTAPLVMINEDPATLGGLFDALSTINGCAIGLDCTPPPPPPPPDTGPDDELTPPPSDDITPPVTPNNPDGVLSNTLVQLEDNQPMITPPLVDEPITGVGNDDLWVPQCSDGEEGCPPPDTGK